MHDNEKYREREWEKHFEHVIRYSKCQHPKPMLVYPPQPLESHLTYAPRATLIHKCSDETGCCQIGKICTERSSLPINLHFKVCDDDF